MRVYTLKLKILTPVFIGSGDELDSLSYAVKTEKDGKRYLFMVDMGRWLKAHSDDPELKDALERFDYLELRKILGNSEDISEFSVYKIEVGSSHFISIYKEILKGKREENQLIVELFPRNGMDFSPYIPASSIKGSIRTAAGNPYCWEAEEKLRRDCNPERAKDKCYSQYNSFIFGKTGFDVFKYLRISDCPLPQDTTKIIKPKKVSKNKKSLTSKDFDNFAEATDSFVSSGNMPELKTKCTIGNFEDLMWNKENEREKIEKRKIKPFDLGWLVEKINEFYLSRYEDELKFYNRPELMHIYNTMNNLKKYVEKEISQNPYAALLRIGRFSHIECMTWDNRKPDKKHGTTRTLADGRYPFGWVLISFEEGYEAEEKKEEQKIQETVVKPAPEPEKELSETEKICKELLSTNDENYSMQIYYELDKFSEEDRKMIARALKQCWQRMKKWGKGVSKKQKEKMKKVEGILGE